MNASSFKVIVFDAYGTLFDVYSIGALAESLYPSYGPSISALWRDKQIEYTRLISQADPSSSDGTQHYLAFWDITERALRYTLRKLKLDETESSVRALMNQYEKLTAFPENKAVLESLNAKGLRCAILSNGSPQMLASAVQAAGFAALIDKAISVDEVRQFKVTPVTYALVGKHYGVRPQEVLFVSSNAWDALGATWYGFTTCWINRQGAPAETIGPPAHFSGANLHAVLDAVIGK
jgi:2-haloacid dehalogenase